MTIYRTSARTQQTLGRFDRDSALYPPLHPGSAYALAYAVFKACGEADSPHRGADGDRPFHDSNDPRAAR